MRFIFLLLFSTVVSIYSGEKPNVLFIIVDDLNDMPLKPQGKPLVPTPHIDSLAESGVNFTNAHCNDPICAPSRTSMMFGLYHGFRLWHHNLSQKKLQRLNQR